MDALYTALLVKFIPIILNFLELVPSFLQVSMY